MANRYDDGYSAMEKAGYPRYEGTLGSRLGPRQGRGFVTSGVIDDFVGVGLRESSISELGIAGTKINTDLPRFGPLNVR